MKTLFYYLMRVDETLEPRWYGRPYIEIKYDGENTIFELRCFEKEGKYWGSSIIYSEELG